MSKYGSPTTRLVTVKICRGFKVINVIGGLISFTRGGGSFPGVKRPGRGLSQRLPFSAENKERAELAFMTGYRGNCTFSVGD